MERFGRVDLLFNNAGTFGPGGVPVEELAYDAWRHVVDTNLNGAFLCAQAAYRQMKEQDPQGGRIINNGSISAHTPRPRSVAYTATKHALTGLTKSLSLDGRPYNIAVGQIDIGNAATDMTERMGTGALQANGEVVPEPVMDVADVARTVRHMAELPLEANVQFATVLATAMPYVGRGSATRSGRHVLNLHKLNWGFRTIQAGLAHMLFISSTGASHLGDLSSVDRSRGGRRQPLHHTGWGWTSRGTARYAPVRWNGCRFHAQNGMGPLIAPGSGRPPPAAPR
ncbi:hypothetical protein SALBM311S_05742 [Streptomyces alboniger]